MLPAEDAPIVPGDDVLDRATLPDGETIGTSREGRPLIGYRFGRGPYHVSLIGGCHADEPVGPAMLDRLASYLDTRPVEDPLLARFAWWIVPHTNPDGDARNLPWSSEIVSHPDGKRAYELTRYLGHTIREPPGEDVEFGFPRDADDDGARPENRAVADFLRGGAPFVLHGSFHGMAFAAGPWFLMEASWADRTKAMRDSLRRRVSDLGYVLHDIDRHGDKGFTRIDEGFTTRPDSRAMVAHFEAAGNPEMAKLFRPSSMEYVRSLGGDPLTLVSEMPLFLLPKRYYSEGDVVYPPVLDRLRTPDPESLRRAAREIGVKAMPIEDQMRLQLAFLEEGLLAAVSNKA